jgi:crotonobetainyl-CoA:carnitine CoA-transferase CaiB-like acyl-CoA transferase
MGSAVAALLAGTRVLDLSSDALSLSATLLEQLGATVARGPWPDHEWAAMQVDAVLLELPRDDGLDGAAVAARMAAAGSLPLVVECSFYGQPDAPAVPLDEFLLQAESGIMAHTGHPERGPCRLGGDFARTLVAVEAAAAIAVGLYARQHGAEPGTLHLSALAALLPCCFHRRLMATTGNAEQGFVGSGISRNGRRLRLIYDTTDGQIVVPYHMRNILPRVRQWMDDEKVDPDAVAAMDSIIDASIFNSDQARIETMQTGLEAIFARHATDDAVDEAQRRGLPAEALKSVEDVVIDPHLAWQGVLERTDEGALKVGPPYRITAHPARPDAPAPAGVPGKVSKSTPFEGLKVISFTTMLAGPILGKRLADLGAEVWRVESSEAEDFTRLSPPFIDADGKATSAVYANVNTGVRSVELNMNRRADAEAAERLVARADILVENMRPGLLSKWGLSTERLWEINPALIIVRLSGMGQQGPYAGHRIVGQSMTSVSGQLNLTGWPDIPPVLTDVPAGDFLAPVFGFFGVASALMARERTGCGFEIDYSEFAGLTYSVLNAAHATVESGRSVTRDGLMDPLRPQQLCALLACADGRQLAVVVPGADYGQALDELASDLRSRVRDLDADAAQRLLAEQGYSVVPYNEPIQLDEDPWLVAIDYFGRIRDAGDTGIRLDGPPVSELGNRPRVFQVSFLGADTAEVLGGARQDAP